ncbi:uncharacterized protein LOC117325491 [Pecten maximus]|uniref:uncharacterized protein LOC117325491 n=1 Tax=Pecten maximus TaxID=6579 RepID=UPI00145840C4|nr:uncharacterized protein LOC117325491 [Pecten maximus]
MCSILYGLLSMMPAAMTTLRGTRILSRDGCVYYNLVVQTSSVANRLLLLLLVIEQFCILVGKRGLRLRPSALCAVLFGLLVFSVLVSSFTVLQRDKYIAKRSIYICLLPLDWLTVTYEIGSYIVPCMIIIFITTYAVYIRKDGRTNSGLSTSTDNRPTLFSTNVPNATISTARILITVPALCIFASLMRLLGSVFNYDSLLLFFALICDVITYAMQPLAFVFSKNVLNNNITEAFVISFSRTTTTSVQSSPPLRVMNETEPIPSISDSLSSNTDATNEDTIDMDAVTGDNDDIPEDASGNKTESSIIDNQNRYDLSVSDSNAHSSPVEFGSLSDVYSYVSTCSPSPNGIENVDNVLSKGTEANIENVQQHSINETTRISHPYEQIKCSKSQRRKSSENNWAKSFQMVQKDNVMQMHGSVMHDTEHDISSVHVNFIGIASSKQYLISMAPGGLFRESRAKHQRKRPSSLFKIQEDYYRRDSDTGEMIVAKYD